MTFQIKKIRYVFFLLMFCTTVVVAACPPTPPAYANQTKFTLEQMIKILRCCNPQIIQAHYNFLAARALVPQILAPNNPQFGIISIPATATPPNYEYTITQSVPFFGKKELAAAIALDQAKFANTQTHALILQLIAQLKINFFQLIYQQKQEQIQKHTIERLELVKQVARARYANNAAAFVDYLNAQTAQNSAMNDLFALTQQMNITRAILNVLINRCPDAPLELEGQIGTVSLPKEALACMEQESLFRNPNVIGANYQLAAAHKGVALAKLGYLPDFNFVITLASDYPPFAGIYKSNSAGLEVDLTIPLWFLAKETNGVAQARASLIATRAQNISTQQQTRLAVSTAYATLRQAIEQSNFISKKQLPQAREAFHLALINYANYSTVTTIAFADLLTAQNNLQQSLLALAQSNVAALQAYANLEMAVGGKVC